MDVAVAVAVAVVVVVVVVVVDVVVVVLVVVVVVVVVVGRSWVVLVASLFFNALLGCCVLSWGVWLFGCLLFFVVVVVAVVVVVVVVVVVDVAAVFFCLLLLLLPSLLPVVVVILASGPAAGDAFFFAGAGYGGAVRAVMALRSERPAGHPEADKYPVLNNPSCTISYLFIVSSSHSTTESLPRNNLKARAARKILHSLLLRACALGIGDLYSSIFHAHHRGLGPLLETSCD